MSLSLRMSDGREINVELGTLVIDFLKTLGDRGEFIGACINDKVLDLQSPIMLGGVCKILCKGDVSAEVLLVHRHSTSHVLAQAVKRLYPEAKLGIGPATEDGFYYDFDVSSPFTHEDLDKISAEMLKIVKENHKFQRLSFSPSEARKKLSEFEQPYKLELLDEIEARGEEVCFYQDGEFIDLCAGPHVRASGQLKHFKLLEVAGAYWRGDEKNKMLQRIYGTAFCSKDELEKYLWQLEEAKKRDHRRLGKDLDLFSSKSDSVGGGLMLWHPKGGLIRYLIEEHCKKRHLESGYDFVYTPHIGRAVLWETSGHLGFYKESMYSPIDIEGQEYYLKPMNCPFHVQIFNSSTRSYREMPIRYAEWGTVYRFERSGTLHGLTRVRGFTQDDAHLFCRADQMPEEIDQVLQFSLSILQDFGFKDFKLFLSTRPEKRVGKDEHWEASEQALKAALVRSGLPYQINEGDGAFYGPKIDIYINDALKRPWQLSTIQFDFNLPERFELSYVGEDGKEHRPYMIHRALLGSMERFFGVLIEHYGGAFPFWLSPVQAIVLPIAERHHNYANSVTEELKALGYRSAHDCSSNTLNYKIRHAQTQKIPYTIVVGDKEEAAKTVAVRKRGGEDLGVMKVSDLCKVFRDAAFNKQ